MSGATRTEDDDDRLIAGVELGGTKAIALLARGRDILATQRFPTTAPDQCLPALSEQLSRWSAERGEPAALGIASFGPVSLDRKRSDYGRITTTPKPGWQQADLVRHFGSRFAVPIGLDTDVAGAALAEHRWGEGRGCKVILYLTIGTGIGMGIVIDGAPVHGAMHPEFGHIRVRRTPGDKFPGICPFHGDCLEGLASGPALAARSGKPGESLGDTDPILDLAACEIAEALAIAILTLSPQRILIGDGVLAQRTAFFDQLPVRTAQLLGGYADGLGGQALSAIIKPPGLGDLAGPLGAIAIGQRALGR